MSSSPPPSKRRKVNATANKYENDNIKSLLSTLFDPHGKRKSKKRKVDAKTIKTVHTPSTIPSVAVETVQLKPTTADEKRGSRQYMKWEDRFNQAKQYYSPNGELISGNVRFLYYCHLSLLTLQTAYILTESYYYTLFHNFINQTNTHPRTAKRFI